MSKTDQHCTRCGKELEEYEDVVVVASGMVESGLAFPNDFAITLSDSPFLEVLCSTCRKPKPNRVVVEVKYGEVVNVRAERPYEVVVAVLDHDIALALTEDRQPYPAEVWAAHDGDKTIGQLNTVKEDPIAEGVRHVMEWLAEAEEEA